MSTVQDLSQDHPFTEHTPVEYHMCQAVCMPGKGRLSPRSLVGEINVNTGD